MLYFLNGLLGGVLLLLVFLLVHFMWDIIANSARRAGSRNSDHSKAVTEALAARNAREDLYVVEYLTYGHTLRYAQSRAASRMREEADAAETIKP